MDGLLVDPSDGAAELPGAVPDPPEPLEPPMFGQSAPLWVFGDWPLGRVVPPPVEGWVVAFGVGVADGSAAKTTAAPPTVRSPTARTTLATVRRVPLRIERLPVSTGVAESVPGGGVFAAVNANGDGCDGWAGTAG